MSTPLNILISGGGIAGSTFARCMLRAHPNTNITIVERAPELRLSGASVDIRSSGVDIIKWMGIEPEIRARSTKETGTAFVRKDGSNIALMSATGDTEMQGMTSEYEIFRGALADIIIRPILEQVKIQSEKGSYDLLIAADGVGSKIRGQMLGLPPREQVRDTGCRVCFFTIKRDMLNGSTVSQWRSLPGGRAIYLRPDPSPLGRTRGNLLVVIPEKDKAKRAKYDQAIAKGNESFMQLLEEEFKGGDWLTADVLKEMRKSDDVYCSLFAQVRSPKLQDGRVVLMGDAGHATPGIGTSLAMTSAYVLAGELLRNGSNVLAATKQYEDIMLPHIKKEQIDFDPLSLLVPQHAWAIAVRDTILWWVDKLRMPTVVLYVASKLGIKESGVKMPDYPWPT
ncbi:hypothetical protein AMS68_003225 [Peltaster fructicola]|uniref:FAD-binding domain-containing protein n=1 Tax=Peltaster fructicola TaxID=286661 RepID=A0A6H0XSW5_9PEZI|nr:hypothetical protein AMS68_003225 [Peltaster fructicola]